MLIISLFVFKTESYAQCAGSDNTITICTKETYNQGIGNPNGVVNLFTLLGVGAVPGGTWTNLNSTAGFNTASGILNTWQINQSGIYNYRYTVTSVPGCTNNTATITLTLGGYPGVDNPSAVACDNNTSVPLFSFLGSNPNPHFNGTFSGGPAGAITGGFFNAQLAGIGTYVIVYTVPSIGTCPSRTATISLTVEELPEAGTPTPLIFCETDDFSSFTNVNLLDQLAGEDGNGSWTDNNATGEITSPTDSFINIQNIYTNFGAGTYTFTYTVTPSNPICPPSSANVAIIIEPVVDINGATLDIIPSSICFNELSTTTYTGTITQGTNPIPNGTYTITYALSGANSGTESVTITFAGGTGNFTINPAFVTAIGTTTVAITSIVNPSSILNCTRPITNLNDTFQIFENPNVSDTEFSVDDFCLGQTGQGNISDSSGTPFELSNGNYIITFDITGPSGTLTGQTATVSITNGAGLFSILNALTNTEGNYSITITTIQNQTSGCSTTTNFTADFQVFPIPDAQTIAVSISSICVGNDVIVTISGATNLPNGFYNLIYDVTGAINAPNQTALNVQFTGGIASFTLPAGILTIGTSTLTITSLVSITNTCNTATFNNPTATFTISELPNVSNASVIINEPICLGSNATGTINAPLLTNGNYTIYYNLSGANTFSGSASVTFTGGNGTITIPSAQLTNTGTNTITITRVENSTTLCSSDTNLIDTFVVSPSPSILVSEVTIQDICLGSDAAVNIASLGGLSSGNYQFTYTLFAANGPSTQTVPVTISNTGNGSFTIPSSLLTNSGLTSITIDTILNTDTGCFRNFSNVQIEFNVNPLPDFSVNTVAIQDEVCLGQDAAGTILNATNLSNGNYSFTYDLSGANTAIDQIGSTTIDTGAGTFIIPGSLLTVAGNTTFTITSITNTTTGCSSTGLSVVATFEVIPLPSTTGATVTATNICISEIETIRIENATGLTDGDYTVVYDLSNANSSTGNTVTVTFTSGNGSFIIPSSLLVNGGTTTITVQNIIYNATQCGSSTLATNPVSFVITDPSAPTLVANGNLFCVQDNPTITSLTSNITSSGTITWYDAPTGGTPYNSSDVLTNGTTYYASLTSGTCEGTNRLEVIVDLTSCSDLFIPDGFSPNNDGLNETFYIKDIDVLYPNFVLEIYNRYGNIVYSGNINTPDFDGKANQSTVIGSDILPTGVYFYILHYNDSTNKKPTQGRLYLSR